MRKDIKVLAHCCPKSGAVVLAVVGYLQTSVFPELLSGPIRKRIQDLPVISPANRNGASDVYVDLTMQLLEHQTGPQRWKSNDVASNGD
jgi:hypothetical protein